MKFAPGEVLLRRHWRGGRISTLFVARVAADDERGLRLWLPEGSPFWRLMTEQRVTHGQVAIDQMPGARLVAGSWARTDAMIWMPPGTPYSVWWFWADGAFAGWKVNLEEPHVRWSDRGCAGVDTADHALDVMVSPDHSWRWKDEEEFEGRIGHPLYWTPAQANRSGRPASAWPARRRRPSSRSTAPGPASARTPRGRFPGCPPDTTAPARWRES